jgi:hypothetical protein
MLDDFFKKLPKFCKINFGTSKVHFCLLLSFVNNSIKIWFLLNDFRTTGILIILHKVILSFTFIYNHIIIQAQLY